MDGRERLFSKIGQAVAGNPLRVDRAAADRRIDQPRSNLIPARADLAEAERLALFIAKSRDLLVEVETVADTADVPAAVAGFLRRHNLPGKVRLAPALAGLDWAGQPLLETATGAATIDDQVSVTPAVTGIAETGTLVLQSGPDTPPTLHFVPDNHVVVLHRRQVVRAMEDAFALLRATHGAGVLPRTVNLVSGPSRTGDVEQKIVIGAHGPRRLHILLVDDGPAAEGPADVAETR
ncbi:MAG: LUD domain-containing protein [Pseudomonadota bacterium]|nr:LUD domain-containing protein [Pseudomonadota bacterium]